MRCAFRQKAESISYVLLLIGEYAAVENFPIDCSSNIRAWAMLVGHPYRFNVSNKDREAQVALGFDIGQSRLHSGRVCPMSLRSTVEHTEPSSFNSTVVNNGPPSAPTVFFEIHSLNRLQDVNGMRCAIRTRTTTRRVMHLVVVWMPTHRKVWPSIAPRLSAHGAYMRPSEQYVKLVTPS